MSTHIVLHSYIKSVKHRYKEYVFVFLRLAEFTEYEHCEWHDFIPLMAGKEFHIQVYHISSSPPFLSPHFMFYCEAISLSCLGWPDTCACFCLQSAGVAGLPHQAV